jgi:hypothetical protein
MKKYLLSMYQPGTEGEMPPPDVLAKVMRDVGAIRNEMKAAGAWVFSGGLDAPGTATVLRLRKRDVLKTDGPFVESKEYVGGFTIVQVADLDEALKWAEKLLQVTGLPMEVRPFINRAIDTD